MRSGSPYSTCCASSRRAARYSSPLDDVQWLDPASASILQIALRRLRDEPVGLLATLRKAPELGEPFELERSLSEDRVERITLGPLTLGAMHRLLEERLGLELTRPELTQVQEATAGNPFFALELGRELARTNTRPTPGQTLPVPESLRELLGGRLARLPGDLLDVLLEVALLARPTVETVAAAYGDEERVIEALEAAVREGVLELDDSRIRFTHPLLASICSEQAPVWKRRAVHRALAAAVSDIEERARHLALAADRPDIEVAAALDAAAEHAAARGATAAAGELFELAADLTLDDPARAQARRLHGAHFHRLSGDIEHAVSSLEQLWREIAPSVARADVLYELALSVQGSPQRQIALCDQALADSDGDDARAAPILGFGSGSHLLGADCAPRSWTRARLWQAPSGQASRR